MQKCLTLLALIAFASPAFANEAQVTPTQIEHQPIASAEDLCANALGNPNLGRGIAMMAKHPNFKILLIAELFLILLTVFIRTYRLWEIEHFLGRFSINFTTTVSFWFFALCVVPFLVLGKAWWYTVYGLYQVHLGG